MFCAALGSISKVMHVERYVNREKNENFVNELEPHDVIAHYYLLTS